ncbi:MAG: hypothetical protein JWR23_3487 [Mucilaginibacter sp.]|nr:hypothetical protein [Mucilaginibacter sp.]
MLFYGFLQKWGETPDVKHFFFSKNLYRLEKVYAFND